MDKYSITQFNTINNYFNHLYEYGYLLDNQTYLTLSAILLIDCLKYFKDEITSEFNNDVNRILHNLECCVCTVNNSNSINNCNCR